MQFRRHVLVDDNYGILPQVSTLSELLWADQNREAVTSIYLLKDLQYSARDLPSTFFTVSNHDIIADQMGRRMLLVI